MLFVLFLDSSTDSSLSKCVSLENINLGPQLAVEVIDSSVADLVADLSSNNLGKVEILGQSDAYS